MLKPSGMLTYSVGPIAGAGAFVGKSPIVDLDDKGDRFELAKLPREAAIVGPLTTAFFVPTVLGTATANAGRCRVVVTLIPTPDGGIGAYTVQVFNDSPGAGDTVTGVLYVILQHRENLAL